jgi:hypothetical protein
MLTSTLPRFLRERAELAMSLRFDTCSPSFAVAGAKTQRGVGRCDRKQIGGTRYFNWCVAKDSFIQTV